MGFIYSIAGLDLVDLAIMSGFRVASDSRDKLFPLLGVNIRKTMQPDYTTRAEAPIHVLLRRI